jgi:hypothetical protein
LRTFELETPHGIARAHVDRRREARGTLVLGHGAGGGVAAPDLTAAAKAAAASGWTVALVEQPYRVAGRRSPAPANQLDASWISVIEELRSDVIGDLPLFTGGRSSGARVACRTSAATFAAAVLCLAFPLRPPRPPDEPEADSRLPELEAVHVPVLIVQGENDAFGIPEVHGMRKVVVVPGDHSLRKAAPVEAAVRDWFATLP